VDVKHKPPLGRLVEVDLRQYWEDEARDFTPWLAQEENLRLLGESIGIPLEPAGTEQPVGAFKADIVAREVGGDGYVLIENQLDRTDHDHLGKLITYAAGRGAKAAVWIAREVTEEHRKALDWLNEVSVEGVGFFGVEIGLWSIGGSPPAPRFNVVVQPNEWARITKAPPGETTETQQLQYEFWRGLIEFGRGQGATVSLRQQPRPQNWYTVAVGRTGFSIALTVNTKGQRVGCELYIDRPDGKRAFSLLMAQRERFEAALGALDWQELLHRRASRVVQYRPADPYDRHTWPDLFGWLLDRAEAFHRVFAPAIKALDLRTEGDEGPENAEAPEES
jgi:hypothetical protein